MSKITINDFVYQLGWDGSKVSRGMEQLEKRVTKMNEKLQRAQKITMKGEKDHLGLLKLKQDLQTKQARRKLAELKLSKATLSTQEKEIPLQMKLGRLEKLSLDIESKKLRILKQKKMLEGDILRKNEQIKQAKSRTAASEERTANASRRHASSSARVARNSKSTANSLRRGADSAQKMQNFLLKGALAYTVFSGMKDAGNSLMTTGMASSRAQVGLDAVSRHIAGLVGAEDTDNFSAGQTSFTKDMAMNLNRDMVATQETWRNMLGASISTIGTHGNEGYKNIKDIFTGVTEASAIFKLNSEQTKLMFLGVTQSLQKGKLQAEEVIRQIAERSPLAIGQLVKAIQTVRGDMSITEGDMYKLMRNGELMAYDILPEWGRNLSRMANELAGSDLGDFMQKSAAGAWDGVGTAIQNIEVGIFERMDKPLARILSTVKELLLSIDFIWKPAATWMSNIFDLANEDLKDFLKTAQKGTGVFANFWGHIGGQEGWDKDIENMTPEQQRKNSEEMFEKSKKAYESIRSFMVGDREQDKMGGFLGGIVSFFKAAEAAVLSLEGVLTPLMEKLGLTKGEDGSIFTEANMGWLFGGYLTANLTGATDMFIAMAGAFKSVGDVLLKLTNPAVMAQIALVANAFTGQGGGLEKIDQVVEIVTSEANPLTKLWQLSSALTVEPAAQKAGGLVGSIIDKSTKDSEDYHKRNESVKSFNVFSSTDYVENSQGGLEMNPYSTGNYERFEGLGGAVDNYWAAMNAHQSVGDAIPRNSLAEVLGQLNVQQQQQYTTSKIFIEILKDGVTTEELREIQIGVDNIINLDISSGQ